MEKQGYWRNVESILTLPRYKPFAELIRERLVEKYGKE